MDIKNLQFNKGDFDFVRTAENTSEVLHKLNENKVYGEILSVLNDGSVSMELRKRIILRAVDETWVNAIEDALPALDEIVRRPARYLEENEVLLPVELTRKISPRTIQHLSQHTGLISEIRDNDTIIPTKLLNVFRDETLNTYENRFINTLLSQLYTFITMRYDVATSNMQDTKTTSLTVDESFTHGNVKGKLKLFFELEQPCDEADKVEKNYIFTTDLWRRIERLYQVSKEYMASDFAKAMGKLYIRPPVMRTNAILKNKNLRQCLALWQFIETYNQTGCAYTVNETLENVKPEYVRDLYSSMAVDYALFRYRMENGFDEDETIAKYENTVPLTPSVVSKLKPTEKEQFEYHYGVGVKMPCTQIELTPVDEQIAEAINICLDAAELANVVVDKPVEEEVALKSGINRSFMAKLIQASQTVQDYYGAVKNEFLSYKKVKSRVSWKYDSFNAGRNKLARLTIHGKTLVLYLNLDPNEFNQNKYHHKDASDVLLYAETPFMLKIKSDRALKYAVELIAALAEKFAVTRGDTAAEDYRLPYESDYRLFKRGLIKVTGDYVIAYEEDENYVPPVDEAPETPAEQVSEQPAIEEVAAAAAVADQAATVEDTAEQVENASEEITQTEQPATTEEPAAEQVENAYKQSAEAVVYDNQAEDSADTEQGEQAPVSEPETTSPTVVSPDSDIAQKYGDLLESAGVGHTEKLVKDDSPVVLVEKVPALRDEPETTAFESQTDDDASNVYDAFSSTRYRRSFTAKMVEADDDTKLYYSEIKSQLLQSKSVKWRISWGFDTFNIGREKLARITVIGKTLVLYLNLDPSAYSENKYHHSDASSVSKVKETPLMLKVRSDRALKHALELIFDLYAKYELILNNPVQQDWIFPEMSFEQMLDNGLIRLEGNAPAAQIAAPAKEQAGLPKLAENTEKANNKKLVLMRARKKREAKLK